MKSFNKQAQQLQPSQSSTQSAILQRVSLAIQYGELIKTPANNNEDFFKFSPILSPYSAKNSKVSNNNKGSKNLSLSSESESESHRVWVLLQMKQPEIALRKRKLKLSNYHIVFNEKNSLIQVNKLFSNYKTINPKSPFYLYIWQNIDNKSPKKNFHTIGIKSIVHSPEMSEWLRLLDNFLEPLWHDGIITSVKKTQSSSSSSPKLAISKKISVINKNNRLISSGRHRHIHKRLRFSNRNRFLPYKKRILFLMNNLKKLHNELIRARGTEITLNRTITSLNKKITLLKKNLEKIEARKDHEIKQKNSLNLEKMKLNTIFKNQRKSISLQSSRIMELEENNQFLRNQGIQMHNKNNEIKIENNRIMNELNQTAQVNSQLQCNITHLSAQLLDAHNQINYLKNTHPPMKQETSPSSFIDPYSPHNSYFLQPLHTYPNQEAHHRANLAPPPLSLPPAQCTIQPIPLSRHPNTLIARHHNSKNLTANTVPNTQQTFQ